jgi:hypothetical protein
VQLILPNEHSDATGCILTDFGYLHAVIIEVHEKAKKNPALGSASGEPDSFPGYAKRFGYRKQVFVSGLCPVRVLFKP